MSREKSHAKRKKMKSCDDFAKLSMFPLNLLKHDTIYFLAALWMTSSQRRKTERTSSMRLTALILTIALILIPVPALALDSVRLITSGKDALPEQGDNDFVQEIYFQMPQAVDAPLFLRLFDPDCGGALDERFGEWNTQTRFELYGSGAVAKTENPTPPLAKKIFGIDDFTDNRWFTVAQVQPSDGEKQGRFHAFKLVITGLSGDDGNVFDAVLSLDDKFNQPPPGLTMRNYEPCFNLPQTGSRFAGLRFFIPENTPSIQIRNFDLENVHIWFESYYKPDLPLKTSGQGEWSENIIPLEPQDAGQWGAVIIQSNAAHHNNAVIAVFDADNRPLPVELPIYLHHPNNRPRPEIAVYYLADCLSVVLDASGSRDPDGHFLEYHWRFGDGKTAQGARVTHSYQTPGTYSGELVVIDDSGRVGARAKKPFTLRINEPPRAMAGRDRTVAPGQTVDFDASGSEDPDGTIVRYLWDFGDGNRVEGRTASHAFTNPGLYGVRLRVEDDSQSLCNVGTDKVDVWVNAPPVVDVGPDRIAAPGEKISFDGRNSFDSDGQIIGFSWDFGDGGKDDGQTVVHAFADPGQYVVTLTVQDDAAVANSAASDELIIIVNDRPDAAATVNFEAAAVGEALIFSAADSLDRDGRIIAYHWDFGDGEAGDGETVDHAYKAPGTYTIQLRVTDDSGADNNENKTSLTVVINDPPVAEAGSDQLVTSSLVWFDGSGSKDPDGQIVAYHWDFGDGETDRSPKPNHFYRRPGTYEVWLTVTDDSGTSTSQDDDSLTVIVNEKPLADAGMDQIAAPGESLTFDGRGSLDPDGSVSAYHWIFGDGTKAQGQIASHTFDKPGRYTAALQVFDDTGHPQATGVDEAIVTINARPVAVAGDNIKAAPGDEIILDGSASYDPDGNITAYQWSFINGKTSVETAKIRKIFENPGVYHAVLTVFDNSPATNSQAQDALDIHINHQPRADAGDPIHDCDLTLAFDGSGSADPDGDILSYYWDFGDESPLVEGVRVVHTFPHGGTYPVILTVNDNTGLANATHQDSIAVTINQAPLAAAGANRTGCAGEVMLFDGSASSDPEGGVLRHVWNFGDGTEAEGVNPAKTYKTGGWRDVTLTVEDDSGLDCSTDLDRLLVYIAEAPVADAGPDRTVCANTLVQFDGSGSRDFDGLVNAYHWDFGDGESAGGKNPTHVYEFPGVYQVRLTITGDRTGDCGNTNADEAVITVHEAPLAAFDAPSSAPVGAAVAFDASGSSASKHPFIGQSAGDGKKDSDSGTIVSHKWDFGDGNVAEGVSVRHVYKTFGNYFVTLTVTSDSENDCNTSEVHKALTINSPPKADAGPDQEAAPLKPVVFDGTGSSDLDGGISAFAWDFGDSETSTGAVARHAYARPGVYTATLTVTDNTDLPNNKTLDTAIIRVNAPPEPIVGLEKDWYCPGEQIRFDGTGSIDPDGEGPAGIVEFQWDFGDGRKGEGGVVSHAYDRPGRYPAILTVDDGSPAANRRAGVSRIVAVNHQPIAVASGPRALCLGKEAVFDGSASFDPDGSILAYQWTFGDSADGEPVKGKTVPWVFSSPGNSEVRLMVTDEATGQCDCATDEAIIPVRVNSPPVADAGPDQEILTYGAHDAVLFNASGSYDTDGDPLTYSWDFGDGEKGAGVKIFHYFEKPGRYTVRLQVNDGAGLECSTVVDEAVVVVKGRD